MSSFHCVGLISSRLLFSHHSINTFLSCFLLTLSAWASPPHCVWVCRSWFPSPSCQVVLSALISGLAFFPACDFSCNWPLFRVPWFSELRPVMLYLCLVCLIVCLFVLDWFKYLETAHSLCASAFLFSVSLWRMGSTLKNTQRNVFFFRIKDFILTSLVSPYIHKTRRLLRQHPSKIQIQSPGKLYSHICRRLCSLNIRCIDLYMKIKRSWKQAVGLKRH